MDIVKRLRFGSPNYFLCGDAAIEIERLREALTWIERHPVEESKQWEVAVKEMKRLARSALPQKETE